MPHRGPARGIQPFAVLYVARTSFTASLTGSSSVNEYRLTLRFGYELRETIRVDLTHSRRSPIAVLLEDALCTPAVGELRRLSDS